jgi:uncharacterized membrane protein YbhN (UPF0104 family)
VNAIQAAIETFASRLSHVSVTLLVLGIALHLGNQLLRATAWRAALAAALPHHHMRGGAVTAAYVAGAGVNAVVPARGGDLARVVLISRRAAPGCCGVTVASTLLVESVLDAAVGIWLAAWAVSSGALPHGLAGVRPPGGTAAVCALAAAAALAASMAAGRARRRARAVLAELQQGLTILRSPRAYLRGVAAPQAAAWAARVGSVYCFLHAFHINAGPGQAALAVLAGSLATMMPLTPAGVGTQQALLVVVLSGVASPAAAISYGLGAQLVITAVNVAAGGTCAGLLLGAPPWRVPAAAPDPVPTPLPAVTSGE